MKHMSDEQFKNDLAVFSNMKEIGAPDFFYTRLKAKMEMYNSIENTQSQIRAIWVISGLTLLLITNSILLKIESTIELKNSNANIETLASAYDQIIIN